MEDEYITKQRLKRQIQDAMKEQERKAKQEMARRAFLMKSRLRRRG